jgi:hypothetical protein
VRRKFWDFPAHVIAPEDFPAQILAHAWWLGLPSLLFGTVITCVSNTSGSPYILHTSSDLGARPAIRIVSRS